MFRCKAVGMDRPASVTDGLCAGIIDIEGGICRSICDGKFHSDFFPAVSKFLTLTQWEMQQNPGQETTDLLMSP